MPKHRGAPQTVLSTAHRLDLAVMLYDKLADILELRFGAKLMRSYGRNQVTMPDGSKWFIRAANSSVGHGMSCDLIVADEIWDIGSTVIDGGLLASSARTTIAIVVGLVNGWDRGKYRDDALERTGA
jgi:hypothetical protein